MQLKLTLLDILGKEIILISNNEFEAGKHEISINISKLNSGLYFYKLETANFSDIKKLMLLK